MSMDPSNANGAPARRPRPGGNGKFDLNPKNEEDAAAIVRDAAVFIAIGFDGEITAYRRAPLLAPTPGDGDVETVALIGVWVTTDVTRAAEDEASSSEDALNRNCVTTTIGGQTVTVCK
jgi:hypothetical protein